MGKNGQAPLVSVVVPVYNVERYVRECLESIRKQTYENIEVLMINDGSTDKSPEICEEYEKLDKRFKLFNKKNGGLSDARNYGLDRMKGEYVCFVDSDDVVNERLVEILLSACKKSGTKIAFCRYQRFRNEIKINLDLSSEVQKIQKRAYLLNVYYQYSQGLFAVSAWAKMYSADIFGELRYRKGIFYEDLDIIDEVVSDVKMLSFVDLPLYYYRDNNSGITKSDFSEKHNNAVAICDRLLEKYRDDTELYQAIMVMKFTRCIEVLTKKKKSGVKILKDDNAYRYIIENRKNVLKNMRARKSIRVAALLACINPKMIILMNCVRKKVKLC